MKKEVYSCLKILEALDVGVRNMWANDMLDSVGSLQKQYSGVCDVLETHLSSEEFKLIHLVEPVNFNEYDYLHRDDVKRGLLQKIMVSLEMAISYLRSMDMDLNKEIIKEKLVIKRQREELDSRTKQVESLQKTFEILIDILSNKKEGIPELMRSRMVEEIKTSHRGIEKNTNPNTNSQKKSANI